MKKEIKRFIIGNLKDHTATSPERIFKKGLKIEKYHSRHCYCPKCTGNPNFKMPEEIAQVFVNDIQVYP